MDIGFGMIIENGDGGCPTFPRPLFSTNNIKK